MKYHSNVNLALAVTLRKHDKLGPINLQRLIAVLSKFNLDYVNMSWRSRDPRVRRLPRC